MRRHAKQLQKRLNRIRKLMDQQPSPYRRMTKDEAIDAMRKIREELWEEKLATRA